MKTLLLALFGIIFSGSTYAQVTPRNILENKYKLNEIQESLILKKGWKPYPKTPEDWKKAVPEAILNDIISKGEKRLTYIFSPISASLFLDYSRTGNRERLQKVSYENRSALMQLVLAETIEGKGRFMEGIMNGVWSICEDSYWGVPAHIGRNKMPDVENPVVDLFSAETASAIALTDYFVGEKLDKINVQLRRRMYHETNERIFKPMLIRGDKYNWMSKTKPVNNWNPWIMSNWLLSSLLLEKDESRRAEMVYGAMVGLDSYLNSLGDDGGCDEGPSYWFAAGACVFDFLELLQKATDDKVTIFENPLIKKMGMYVYNMHIDGNYFVNFADANPSLVPDGLMLYRFGNATSDDQMLEFGKWAYQNTFKPDIGGWHRMRIIENLLTINKIDKSPSSFQPVKDAWFKDIEVMVARSGKGLFLATHGGHNAESHNHNDVGDFIIYQNGQPMVIDAGRGNYTAKTFSGQRYELWFTRSEYHNLPIINGFGQEAGAEYKARGTNTIINNKEAILNLDIAAAYPKEAGISTWNRSIKMDRIKNQVELSDDFLFASAPKSLQQVFMTICDIDFSQKGKIILKGEAEQALTINYNDKLWQVSVDLPSNDGMEYDSFKNKWDGKVISRIILTQVKPKQKGNYNFTFVPNI